MVLQNRDYMREGNRPKDRLNFPTLPQHRWAWWTKMSLVRVLTITALVIFVASSALWLYRDAKCVR
jgi:hypothetical protein